MAGYSTLDNVAAAALARINAQPGAESREYISLLFESDGSFKFTEPQRQSGRRSRGRTKGAFTIPAGSARGIVHNHPGDPLREDLTTLSAEDVTTARGLALESFIGVGDALYSWNPKTGETRGSGRDVRGIAEAVLHEIDVEEARHRLMSKLLEFQR